MNEKLNPGLWVERYGDYLFSISLLKLGDRELAKDIVQETFLAAYKARLQFRGDAAEKTWLTTILKNKITDYYRSAAKGQGLTQYLGESETSFFDRYYETNPERGGHYRADIWKAPQADMTVNRKETAEAIRSCADQLPPKFSPVFWAKFVDEKKTEDICKEFNISSSNYWVIIHRVKVLLYNCLKKKGLMR